jgi:hypothetical protein
VVPALRALHGEGYTIGLISNFEGWLEEMLAELNIGDVFDVTVIAGIERVGKRMPASTMFRRERALPRTRPCTWAIRQPSTSTPGASGCTRSSSTEGALPGLRWMRHPLFGGASGARRQR